jgi:hypothetical protein
MDPSGVPRSDTVSFGQTLGNLHLTKLLSVHPNKYDYIKNTS